MTVKDLTRWEETDEPGVYRRRTIDPAEQQPATIEVTSSEETVVQQIVVPQDATAGAIRLADKHGLDLANISGTGKNGRITKTDVEAAIQE